MYEHPPRYYSFILRFWEERSENQPAANWRFALEQPESHVRYGFSSLEELVAFLQKHSANVSAETLPSDTK